MTTDEMRADCLQELDDAAAGLRVVCSDPMLANTDYPPLKNAMMALGYAVQRIIRTNLVIIEAEQR